MTESLSNSPIAAGIRAEQDPQGTGVGTKQCKAASNHLSIRDVKVHTIFCR